MKNLIILRLFLIFILLFSIESMAGKLTPQGLKQGIKVVTRGLSTSTSVPSSRSIPFAKSKSIIFNHTTDKKLTIPITKSVLSQMPSSTNPKTSSNFLKEFGLDSVAPPSLLVSYKPEEKILLKAQDGVKIRRPNDDKGKFTDIKADGTTAYLYTIDNNGVNIILRDTPVNGHLPKHTNLSERASTAGELKFNTNGSLVVNLDSGRFGMGNTLVNFNDLHRAEEQDRINSETLTKVKKVFETLGYSNVKINHISLYEGMNGINVESRLN